MTIHKLWIKHGGETGRIGKVIKDTLVPMKQDLRRSENFIEEVIVQVVNKLEAKLPLWDVK